jgi:uncharacterized protein YcgL (UPF0745 family)
MKCWIYKGSKAFDTYVYLPGPIDENPLPQALSSRMGTTELVMELELTADRKLARTDVATVMAAIESQGFYLQMPPPRD